MPYIKEERRREFRRTLSAAQDVGELNYQITCLINKYMFVKGESYQTYNDIMGALEGAKLELYRRKIAPYEDKKCEENGDVYSIQKKPATGFGQSDGKNRDIMDITNIDTCGT